MDDLLNNEAVLRAVVWVRDNIAVAIVGAIAAFVLVHVIGAYCAHCGSRERVVDNEATATSTLVASAVKGGLSVEIERRCARCGQQWETARFWRGLKLLLVLAALAIGYLEVRYMQRLDDDLGLPQSRR